MSLYYFWSVFITKIYNVQIDYKTYRQQICPLKRKGIWNEIQNPRNISNISKFTKLQSRNAIENMQQMNVSYKSWRNIAPYFLTVLLVERIRRKCQSSRNAKKRKHDVYFRLQNLAINILMNELSSLWSKTSYFRVLKDSISAILQK